MRYRQSMHSTSCWPTPGSGDPGEKGAAVGAPGAFAICIALTWQKRLEKVRVESNSLSSGLPLAAQLLRPGQTHNISVFSLLWNLACCRYSLWVSQFLMQLELAAAEAAISAYFAAFIARSDAASQASNFACTCCFPCRIGLWS